jgi:hypothetical protein
VNSEIYPIDGYIFGYYLSENTLYIHYKVQPINSVKEKSYLDLHETCKYIL